MNVALLLQITRQDLVDRYAGSLLGGLWTFIQPLVNMLVFILVFSRVMSARLPDLGGAYSYSIYLISGLLGWVAFSSTLTRTTTVFLDQASLIKKVRISLWSFPLSIILSDTIVFVISLFFFLVFLALVSHPLTTNIAWLPLVFVIQQAFAYSLGLIFASFTVFFRDIKESVSVLVQLWFWMTPIVYVASILSEQTQYYLKLNPMYSVIDAYHSILLLGEPPAVTRLIWLAAMVALLIVLSGWVLRRLESDIRDLL